MSLVKLKKILKRLFKILIIILLILIPTGIFLVGTNSGLKIDLYLIKKITGAKLSVKKIDGTLAKNLSLKEVNYQTPNLTLKIKQLNLSWSMLKSIYSGINIKDMQLEEVFFEPINIKSKNKDQDTGKPGFKYSSAKDLKTIQNSILKSLPQLHFQLHNIKIKKFHFISQNYNVLLKSLLLDLKSNKKGLLISKFNAQFKKQNITINGFVNYAEQFTTKINVSSHGLINSITNLSGNINEYIVLSKVSKPFTSSLKINLTKDLKLSSKLEINHAYWPLTGAKQIRLPQMSLNFKTNKYNYYGSAHAIVALNNLPTNNFSLNASGNNKDFNLLLNLGINKLKLNGKYNLPIAVDLNIPLINKLLPQLDFIHTGVSAKGTISNNSHVKIKLNPGYLKFAKQEKLNFKTSIINLTQTKNALLAKGALNFNLFRSIKLNAKLPDFNLTSLKNQKILSKIEFDFNNIAMIDKFISDLKNSQGKLHGIVNINGLISSPKLSMNLKLTKATTQIDRLG